MAPEIPPPAGEDAGVRDDPIESFQIQLDPLTTGQFLPSSRTVRYCLETTFFGLMEQPCYRCGQTVEEGIPFCPHCSAPQIRVITPESADVVTPTPAAALPASDTVPVLAVPMSWSDALKPCALAALVASLLMSLGLHPFVAMASVGFLAVLFCRQRRPATVINAGTGLRLGALGGLLWFAISSILETAVVLVQHKGPELRKGLLAVIDQAASRTSDPQTLAILDRFRSPDGLEALMVFAVISGFVIAIVLAALGGALAGAILGRRNKA